MTNIEIGTVFTHNGVSYTVASAPYVVETRSITTGEVVATTECVKVVKVGGKNRQGFRTELIK